MKMKIACTHHGVSKTLAARAMTSFFKSMRLLVPTAKPFLGATQHSHAWGSLALHDMSDATASAAAEAALLVAAFTLVDISCLQVASVNDHKGRSSVHQAIARLALLAGSITAKGKSQFRLADSRLAPRALSATLHETCKVLDGEVPQSAL